MVACLGVLCIDGEMVRVRKTGSVGGPRAGVELFFLMKRADAHEWAVVLLLSTPSQDKYKLVFP